MKKLYLLFIPSFCFLTIYAQRLDDVRLLLSKNQIKEANQAVDELLKNPKKSKDPEVWYYKGAITNAYSKASDLKGEEVFQYKQISFEAYKQTQILDKTDKLFNQEKFISYYDLYAGAYNLGVAEYNKKNFSLSMHAFMLTLEIDDYIQSKGYTYSGIQMSKLDTGLLINIVVTALQSDSTKLAFEYYKRIAEAGIQSREVRNVTEDMLSDQLKKGDDNMMNSIFAYATKLFPQEEIWLDYQLKFYENKRDKKLYYQKYEELIASYPKSFTLTYNYAVELYNDMHVGENLKEVNDTIQNKFMIHVQNAIINEQNKDMLARFLLDRHLFNEYNDKQKAILAIKGNKPQDISTKNNLKADLEKISSLFITNSESVVSLMDGFTEKTPIQKANYKLVLQMLTEIYTDLKNKQKVNFYEIKIADLDKG